MLDLTSLKVDLGAEWYALQGENMKKCIRMGMTVLKMSFGEVILRSQIAFYSSIDVSP